MYKALDVASYIIEKHISENKIVSNLKLQKILYFIQAEFLMTTGKSCFHEPVEAWDFGPVISDVYHCYQVFGSANIPACKRNSNPAAIHNEDIKLIDGIINKCAEYSAASLTEITQKQTPWKANYIRNEHNIIPNEDIKRYFET